MYLMWKKIVILSRARSFLATLPEKTEVKLRKKRNALNDDLDLIKKIKL